MSSDMITYDELKALDACDEARKWWRATYGPEAEVSVADALAACKRADWIVWFASRRHPDLGYVWAGMAMRWAAITAYADNVTADNWREARAAADAAGARDAAACAGADADAAYAAGGAAYAAARAGGGAAWAADTAAWAAYAAAWREMAREAACWLVAGGRP